MTDNWRLESGECTSIRCHNRPTMTLDVKIQLGEDTSYVDNVPYCDDCIGWFYRSFVSKPYKSEVLGITVILTPEEEYGLD